MASILPVIRGCMGSVEYYLTTMKAGKAVKDISIAEELPKWKEMTIEERAQRELEWKRVEKDIAQYIASDPDRFYGALLVAIYNSEGISFEPLTRLKGLPELYVSVSESFGFLHFKGGELLFTLDGQHRLKGTDVAISGKGKNGKPIEGLTPNLDVAKDDISIILIPYEPALRARKIFNKTNKYAKQTSKGDNIITSEDDAYAITARRLMGSGGYETIIEEALVNWSSNTLSARSTQFTTINVLYESGQKFLDPTDIQFRPDEELLDEFYHKLAHLWTTLIDQVEIFRKALDNPKHLPKLREKYLCLKPAGQLALLTAVQEALSKGMLIEDIAIRLNDVPWESDNDLWQGVVMQGKRIQAGKQTVSFAGRLVAYLIGVPYDTDEQHKLLMDLRRLVEKDPEKPVKAKTLPNTLLPVWQAKAA